MADKKVEFDLSDCAIICKEFSKNSADVAVYEVKIEITGSNIQILKLRHRFNTELNYYITKKENLEYCLKALKVPFHSEIEIKEGILVEL